MSPRPSFKDMPVWQRSMRLAAEIYQLTAQLPATERLGISTSLQQSITTVPTLLASGTKLGRAGFHDACVTARHALATTETLLLLVQQLYPGQPVDDLLAETDDLQTALVTMASRLAKTKPPARSV